MGGWSGSELRIKALAQQLPASEPISVAGDDAGNRHEQEDRGKDRISEKNERVHVISSVGLNGNGQDRKPRHRIR